MKIPIAILAAALLLAACYWFNRPRYEFHIANNSIMWRCDRQTGTVSWAIPSVQNPTWHFIEAPPTWAETSAIETGGTRTGDIFDQIATNADGLEIVARNTNADGLKRAWTNSTSANPQ